MTVTPCFCSTHASATCARGTPRAAATLPTRLDDEPVGIREFVVERLAEFVGLDAVAALVPVRGSAGPRASGLQGMTAMPWSTQSGSISRSSSRYMQVDVVLHADELASSRAVARYRSPWQNCQAYMEEAPM